MHKIRYSILVLIFVIFTSFILTPSSVTWGFYAHKLINRMAIFTLPPELGSIFKANISQIRASATAPDQRRYASLHEAARHYMDLDHWGEYPFENVPRNYKDAVWKFGDIYLLNTENSDTLNLKNADLLYEYPELREKLLDLFYINLRYADNHKGEIALEECLDLLSVDSFPKMRFYNILHFENVLEEYGIVPYHLIESQKRLTQAFLTDDRSRLIRLLGEMGHYISDAHVPLHTTENYNGQLTGQLGIHAFWETRIPELFAEKEYDFWVGKAEYIEDKENYYWDIVLTSHLLVKDVLQIELELRESFPKDQQFCYDERNGSSQRLQCEAYARAYQNKMAGMVEKRMKQAIHAVGSAWYTAWIDAGQPRLEKKLVVFNEEVITVDSILKSKSRVHEFD